MKCINFSHSRSSSFLMTSASNHVLGTCTADTWTRVPRKRMRLEMQLIFCSLTKVLVDASVTPWVSIFCSWQKSRNNRGCIATVSPHWQREGRNMLSKNDIALNTRRTQKGQMLIEMQFKFKTLLLNYFAFLLNVTLRCILSWQTLIN